MDTDSYIEFVLINHVQGMFFTPDRPDGMEFVSSGTNGLRFVLLPRDPSMDSCGHRSGLECKVYARISATADQADFVKSYNNRKFIRVADDVCLPVMANDETQISKDGVFGEHYWPRRSVCPTDIQHMIETVETELSVQANRFLGLIRWRQGIDAPADVVEWRTLYWRVDGSDYPITPKRDSEAQLTQALYGIRWNQSRHVELEELWMLKDLTEPLGHILLREAYTLASESPRSSIMVMTAALESAIKIHIGKAAPETAWLMEEIPSPPIYKILRDYIPLIHKNRGNEIFFWDKVKPLINKTQKLIETRNKVAHTGRIPIDASTIQDNLQLVSDLLYLLDILDGHEWAKTFVSWQLRKVLNWPDPTYPKIEIRIEVK